MTAETIYPVICHSKQKLMEVFPVWEDAQKYCLGLIETSGRKDYFLVNEITRGRLEQFKRAALVEIYARITNSEANMRGSKATIAKRIIEHCQQPPHLPRRHLAPLVDLKGQALDPDALIEGVIVDTREYMPLHLVDDNGKKHGAVVTKKEFDKTLRRMHQFKNRRRKDRRRNITDLYLDATGEYYAIKDGRPSARYLFHRYITEGLDVNIVLQRVSNQTGKKQTVDTYFRHKFEVQKLCACQ